jgi:hypothetical protein
LRLRHGSYIIARLDDHRAAGRSLEVGPASGLSSPDLKAWPTSCAARTGDLAAQS